MRLLFRYARLRLAERYTDAEMIRTRILALEQAAAVQSKKDRIVHPVLD